MLEARNPARPAWTAATGTALRVAQEVLLHGPLSRAELARRFDLTPGTLTRITKALMDEGVLTDAGAAGAASAAGASAVVDEARLGRPSQPLDVVGDGLEFVGVKVTGDHAYAVRTTVRAEVLRSADADLPSADPAAVSDVVADLVTRLGDGAARVGVSVGGHVTATAVRHGPFLDWNEVPFGALLAERLGRAPVLSNDVVAITEATHWFGEARGRDRFALVTIGAGTGLGLVTHGRIVMDDDVGLGLVGHLPLDPFGPVCHLGHRGCADAVLTTSALTTAASVALGRALTHGEVLALAGAGDPAARRVVEDAARVLGKLVALVANITMPQLVVIGGEGAPLMDVAGQVVRDAVAADRDPRAATVAITVQEGGLAAWARGAAVIAIQDFVGAR
ncbi:ROK family transcriptional regulator [Serinibacter arcticus]|uniref:Uncharacterized protein n=1 Tax=Serinibacter arcticus TaxID=1655435 RepID=A0A4Z1E761_9MICO|nr:ROK family transcriptional regulator [Serinibacter arcticus]TGO06648.1 hypothetical protein SERN_0840 [Serinibacter arcticus]